MRIKSLAQGENILMLGIEPSTFVSKVNILNTTPIVHDDVITISNQVANYFSARQYPKHIIESANKDIHSIHREDILMPSCKKVSPDRIPLILPFHHSIYPLRRIILKHYKTLMTDQDTKDIFKLLPIRSYKREPNLCNVCRRS